MNAAQRKGIGSSDLLKGVRQMDATDAAASDLNTPKLGHLTSRNSYGPTTQQGM